MLKDFLNKHFPDRCVAGLSDEEVAVKLLREAYQIKDTPVFSACVFYNIGLGWQTRNLPEIEVETEEQAEELAKVSADTIIGKKKWSEVRIRRIK